MPPRARAKAPDKPQTTQQRLAAVIKRCRDIMRIDPGLNGDLDRLPQMAWLLFLKAFDDLEERRAVLDEDHRPAIVERLHREVVEAVKNPKLVSTLAEQGISIVGSNPAELRAFIRSDTEKYRKIVQAANIRVE